jgi:hypothetical protein
VYFHLNYKYNYTVPFYRSFSDSYSVSIIFLPPFLQDCLDSLCNLLKVHISDSDACPKVEAQSSPHHSGKGELVTDFLFGAAHTDGNKRDPLNWLKSSPQLGTARSFCDQSTQVLKARTQARSHTHISSSTAHRTRSKPHSHFYHSPLNSSSLLSAPLFAFLNFFLSLPPTRLCCFSLSPPFFLSQRSMSGRITRP